MPSRDYGLRLAPGVLDHLELRVAAAQLLHPGNHDLELEPELRQDLALCGDPDAA